MAFGKRKDDEYRMRYDEYRAQDPDLSAKERDVYNDQQVVRSRPPEPIKPTSRIVGSCLAMAGIAFLVWTAISLGEFLIEGLVASFTGGHGIVSPGEVTFPDFGEVFCRFYAWKLLISLAFGVLAGAAILTWALQQLKAQNEHLDHSDINQYVGDQHIAFPEEIQEQFDVFPDVGAHSSVQVSSMISHMMLENKGIKKVEMTRFWDHDDEEAEAIRGEPVEDEEGNLVTDIVPMFDRKFGDALFEASGAPERFRRFYDPKRIPYNPGNRNRDKLKGYDTVADVINGDWEIPDYEVQRPAGAYMVDTAPVNTMVLAITRAGKGQTIIEPTIDMWLREKRPNNIVVNDPKGELLIKNYVPATMRGFQVVQFNLINPLKTDIYNPLAMAADAAREGDFTKCSMYIENIANVFFPLDGGEDPVWPNAANNAFKRAAYGLIDYYLEEEREMRVSAERDHVDPKVLETMVDELWGHVTLYNCYQLFVQLTAKKKKNPLTALNKDPKKNDYTDEEWEAKKAQAEREAPLWADSPEADLLTLYFSATERLPKNQMRTLVADTNNALKAMGGAEKMMASVYGIAITAMSFFTDPTVSTLTSGTPSQNVDLAGLSFPRRFGVRFQPEFVERNSLVGLQAVWDGFTDASFTECLGKDFHHEDFIRRDGWARCYIDGKFPKDVGYLRLRLVNSQTGQQVRSFYFEYTKGYQTSLDGSRYAKDPILSERIVKNGVLREMARRPDGSFAYGHVTFATKKPKLEGDSYELEDVREHAIFQMSVRYAEKPKIVFLVTPPHLMKYAKLLLILIKQLVDLNFDQSYMTKANQKPLYKTRFMLDELGNLQSEGHGIDGFQTMLSIGLGQDQQFTLILQTLQQLKDVYGSDVDRVIQGNAQPLSAKLVTPTGYIRMGDVRTGDVLVTPEGKFTQVEGVFPRGVRKVYRVTRRDGASTLACGEHLWRVRIKH